MKKYFTLFIAVAFMFSSCLKDDVDGLQKQIDDLENRTSELEAQIKLYSDLQKAHENNLHITNIISQDNGTTLVMNDGSQIFVPNSDSVTPYVGDNGNWWVDGKDTGKYSIGTDGITPHVGDNGNWFIGDTDTGKPSTGKDGTDGQTPHIGENGNWFIGGVDTGILAAPPTIVSIQYIEGEMVYNFSDGSTLKLQIENKEEIEKQKNWKAIAVNGGYTLITYNGTETRVVIPNTIYGKPVVELGVSGATSIDFSVIPTKMRLLVNEIDLTQCISLNKINDYAFSGLTKIQEIELPKSLLSINENSFNGCIDLKTVTILKATEQFTTCKWSSFENTPIKNGVDNAKIIYPVGTPYPTVDAWFSNNAAFYDSDGNSEYPVIVINGSTEMKIPKGGTYTEEGATASSNGVDLLPVEITYTSIFNPSSTGVETNSVDVYEVAYSAIDEDGDRTTEYRYVYITNNGNMVDNIEGIYISDTGRSSESFTGLKYVIISKRADGKYDLSHAIGGYYALGRNYGSLYAFIGSVITDDGGGVYSATGGQAPGWGNISVPSDFVINADAKTIGFVSTADFGSVFTVLLTQDSSFD